MNLLQQKNFEVKFFSMDDRKDEITSEGNTISQEYSLDTFDMLRVIGTGTFARVCLCQVRDAFKKKSSYGGKFSKF